MRIVWKDSNPKLHKPIIYRNHMVFGSPEGWETNIPGDDNLYAAANDALNAIDKALGGHGRNGASKYRNGEIRIIGKKGGKNICV